MKVSEFNTHLLSAAESEMRFVFPDGDTIPLHAHVTEVGRVDKQFIDCGGTVRSVSHCTLQVWVAANDEEHRFAPGKLARVMGMAAPVLRDDDLEVEVEFEDCGGISQYPILSAEAADERLIFRLGTKHTDCLAKEACGLTAVEPAGCCQGNC